VAGITYVNMLCAVKEPVNSFFSPTLSTASYTFLLPSHMLARFEFYGHFNSSFKTFNMETISTKGRRNSALLKCTSKHLQGEFGVPGLVVELLTNCICQLWPATRTYIHSAFKTYPLGTV